MAVMTTYKRSSRSKNRIIRNALAINSAAEALGPIERGCEIYALSVGQFSLVDVIQHVLAATGPARVLISTWTAAAADVDIAYALLGEGKIESMKFLVDFSFPVRQPAYCAALRERFGDAAIRVTKNHAKFVMIRNSEWSIVIRTSMNLNENKRLESVEISDDSGLADFLEGVIQSIFDAVPDGQCFTNKPGDNMRQFAESFPVSAASSKQSADEAKYFGKGAFDNDIRRAGVGWD